MTTKTRMVLMSTYSYDRWDAAAEEAMHNDDLYPDDTTVCEGCQMRILLTENVSPPEVSEPFCVLCLPVVLAEQEAL